MATPSDDFRAFMAGLPPSDRPTWSDAEDLGRISRAAAARLFGNVGAFLDPSGTIRLTGAGVDGHTARFDAVGAIITSTQHVVTAIGAALQGFKTARGAFSNELLHRTALGLTASPAPGSIILSFSPADSQVETEYALGEVPLDATPNPLVDRAFAELFDLLQDSRVADPNPVQFTDHIAELGPRVASSLRTWTEALRAAHVDAEISWSDAQAERRTETIRRSQSAWISEIVAGRMLDALPTEILGIVRTVSDVSSWAIDIDDGPRTSVRIDDLAPSEITPVRVGDRVRLQVLMQEKTRPGSPSTFSYSATAATVINT